MFWMFCRKKGYLKIEKIKYKSLKIISNSSESYEELLTRSFGYRKEIPYNLRNAYALKLP